MNIIHGDSLDKLKELEDNSIDSIVTDPPYGLSFMGRKWDYDVPSQEIWEECLRVLKPGGYLLAFAGTRTQHRMAVRIEDAGFEIRDMIAWVYGSGFPKSLNIGKAVDKLQGNEREVVGEKDINAIKALQKFKEQDGRTTKTDFSNIDIGITKGTSPYEGYGTALKPSLESITVAQKSIDFAPNLSPIIMSRKPISEKTVAQNVLKYGTGGINIDGCRVGTGDDRVGGGLARKNFGINGMPQTERPTGARFPANLIHDGSDEVVGLFPNTKNGKERDGRVGGQNGLYKNGHSPDHIGHWFGDSGSASRFFYCAKASKSERNKGCEELEEKQYSHDGREKEIENAFQRNKSVATNNHPTVKPISLMQYLVRLVTPKGGTVLDPFMGSGTTGIGAKLEGFDFIGIEREAEYIKIAEARINAWEKEKQKKLV
jgi:site-specific DNA-methyltransferase (adenine-specific)